MSGITTLDRSPPADIFLDGMELGSGVDAVTGELTKSALAASFSSHDVTPSGAADTFTFRMTEDSRDIESSVALGTSSSITAPIDGVTFGAKRSFEFSSSAKSSVLSLFILLSWEHQGQSKRITSDTEKLSDEATIALKGNKETFRDKFGDYYVNEIAYKSKFFAIWRCTAEKTSDLKSFKAAISGSVSVDVVEGSSDFTTTLSKAAKTNSVSIDVRYVAIGDAGNTVYDIGEVIGTFKSFRKASKPIPFEVHLRHYSRVHTDVPYVINMDTNLFARLCDVFSKARFVLFLNSVAPGSSTTRMSRRDELMTVLKAMRSKRLSFQANTNDLKKAIDDLDALRNEILDLLARQDLIVDVQSLTYEQLKGNFNVHHEDEYRAWVRTSKGVSEYVIGRTSFDAKERKKYAIEEIQCADVSIEYGLFDQKWGSLDFPGATGVNGYVVGLRVQDCWGDGTNGWWGVPRGVPFGTKQAKIQIKSEGSRGMHWKLRVYYIPCSKYDG